MIVNLSVYSICIFLLINLKIFVWIHDNIAFSLTAETSRNAQALHRTLKYNANKNKDVFTLKANWRSGVKRGEAKQQK